MNENTPNPTTPPVNTPATTPEITPAPGATTPTTAEAPEKKKGGKVVLIVVGILVALVLILIVFAIVMFAKSATEAPSTDKPEDPTAASLQTELDQYNMSLTEDEAHPVECTSFTIAGKSYTIYAENAENCVQAAVFASQYDQL